MWCSRYTSQAGANDSNSRSTEFYPWSWRVGSQDFANYPLDDLINEGERMKNGVLHGCWYVKKCISKIFNVEKKRKRERGSKCFSSCSADTAYDVFVPYVIFRSTWNWGSMICGLGGSTNYCQELAVPLACLENQLKYIKCHMRKSQKGSIFILLINRWV